MRLGKFDSRLSRRQFVKGIVGATALLSTAALTSASASSRKNRIRRENKRAGTSDWMITSPCVVEPSTMLTCAIEGYASETSVLPGESISFHISATPAAACRMQFYRMGWYQGAGARELVPPDFDPVRSVADLSDVASKIRCPMPAVIPVSASSVDPWADAAATPQNVLDDYDQNRVLGYECDWPTNCEITIPKNWCSGVYLVKLTLLDGPRAGSQSFITFVVRSRAAARILVKLPVNTYQAYNAWIPRQGQIPSSTYTDTCAAVSFNRPYDLNRDWGAGNFLAFEHQAVLWLEMCGFDVGYITDVDLHRDADLLAKCRCLLSLGHDEYWTGEMRDNVERAIDEGLSVAFLGANPCYWQIRYDSVPDAEQSRILICYKGWPRVGPDANTYVGIDPLVDFEGNAIPPSQATLRWRDPALARAEEELAGQMYMDYLDADLQPPLVLRYPEEPEAVDWLFEGTGVSSEDPVYVVPGIVAGEFDRVFSDDDAPQYFPLWGTTPIDLSYLSTYWSGRTRWILADSPVVFERSGSHVETNANVTIYESGAGGWVFSAGTFSWSWGLANLRQPLGIAEPLIDRAFEDPVLQRLTYNLVVEMTRRRRRRA